MKLRRKGEEQRRSWESTRSDRQHSQLRSECEQMQLKTDRCMSPEENMQNPGDRADKFGHSTFGLSSTFYCMGVLLLFFLSIG